MSAPWHLPQSSKVPVPSASFSPALAWTLRRKSISSSAWQAPQVVARLRRVGRRERIRCRAHRMNRMTGNATGNGQLRRMVGTHRRYRSGRLGGRRGSFRRRRDHRGRCHDGRLVGRVKSRLRWWRCLGRGVLRSRCILGCGVTVDRPTAAVASASGRIGSGCAPQAPHRQAPLQLGGDAAPHRQGGGHGRRGQVLFGPLLQVLAVHAARKTCPPYPCGASGRNFCILAGSE